MGDTLKDLEITTATKLEKRRRRYRYPQGGHTRIAKQVRGGKKVPPPVPKNKALSEIKEMDPHDEAFRTPRGRPRKWVNTDGTPKVDVESLGWRDRINYEQQIKFNNRRAKIRKYEAEVIAATRTMEEHVSRQTSEKLDIYDEDKLLAEQILDFDDWDNEELIRGYRRGRAGRFGAPPKYIPREVQQAAFRILVGRGDRKLKTAYVESIEQLVDLARSAESEKVRLEAIKEVMNRVVGKVPDTLLVAHEAPWEGVLADSMVPLSETPPLEMEVDDDGVARLPYIDTGGPREGVGVERPSDLAADPVVEAPPTPPKPRAPDPGRSKVGTPEKPERIRVPKTPRVPAAKARKGKKR